MGKGARNKKIIIKKRKQLECKRSRQFIVLYRYNFSFACSMKDWSTNLLMPTKPIFFENRKNIINVIEAITTLYNKIKNEFSNNLNCKGMTILNSQFQEILPTMSGSDGVYEKSRMSKEFLSKYFELLQHLLIPEGFRILNSNIGCLPIVFHNISEDICETHHDRDNSILFLLGGKKDILLNCSAVVKKKYVGAVCMVGMGSYDGIHPFEESKDEIDRKGWKMISLHPGDCLYIPKHVVHSVKSYPGTIAISFQIVRDDDMDGRNKKRLTRSNYNAMMKDIGS